MEQLKLGSVSIDLVRKDIKNLHLGVYPPTGRVRLAVPLNVDYETARLFAISKMAWIRRHQRNFLKQERTAPREYKERESHYFQGRRYLLRIKETAGAGYVDLKGKTYLDLYVKSDATPDYRQNVINDWYRAELRKIIPELIAHWEKKMSVVVNDWGIKQMKTKWGSCNIEAKRIWLNLELAKKPVHCLEYIIVHEMVHLLERHHNANFKSLMDHYLPKWKHLKEELNRIPVSHADWSY
jgi:predicted metal-dependent hydrolase